MTKLGGLNREPDTNITENEGKSSFNQKPLIQSLKPRTVLVWQVLERSGKVLVHNTKQSIKVER